jgi:heme A synthase
MCAGAYVSSSGAGLACPSIAGCGPAFLGQTVPQAVQMTHRFFAAAFVLLAIAAAILLPRSRRRATAALRIALVLLAFQIALGMLNVLWSLPTALREAHAANAIATFLGFVIATVFASLEVRKSPRRARVPSQAAVPATFERSPNDAVRR